MGWPAVGVLVLNYDGQELLEQYLGSVTDLSYGNYETFVVDNGSSDGSVSYVRENHPDVEVIAFDQNLGYSKAFNRAVERIPEVDYIWTLNNDVRATPESLGVLVDHAESTPEAGIVVPRINEMDSDEIQSLGQRYNLFGYWPPLERGREEPSTTEPHDVPFAMGAAMMVDREVWDELGGFDEANFIYSADQDLSFRAWVRGHHVQVVPESLVYHERDATIGKMPPFTAYDGAQNKTRVHLKTLQLKTILLGLPGFVGLLLAQSGKDIVVRHNPKVAAYRVGGMLSAFASLPEIYRDRRRIQSERVYDDEQFLTPLRNFFE